MANQARELSLGDYVGVAKRRWPWIVGTFVIGLGLVAVFTLTRDQVYTSRADVLLLTETSAGQFSFEPAVEQRLERSSIAELQVAVGQKYLVSATDALGYVPDVELSLVPSANANDPSSSSVLRVVGSGSSADVAMTSAQVFADTYVTTRTAEDVEDLQAASALSDEQIASLQARRDEIEAPVAELRSQRLEATDPAAAALLDAQISSQEATTRSALASIDEQLAVVSAEAVELDQTLSALDGGVTAARILNPAYLPEAPTSPDVPRNLLLGAVVALVLGLLLATLRELLDAGASDAHELASAAETPVIAAVPRLRRDRGAPGGVVPFSELPDEQSSPYRVLLDSVWLSQNGRAIRTVAVTAVRTGLGSTQTAVNMALAEARRGVDVCLVDADFSAPAVERRLGLSTHETGLADLLAGRSDLDVAVALTETPGLDVIGPGRVDRSTPDHLRSARLGDLLTELRSRYELVVVDTPSISGMAGSRTVASQCDGVVVVYDHASSKRDDVVTAVDVLRSAKARPIGLVSNRSSVDQQIHLSGPG